MTNLPSSWSEMASAVSILSFPIIAVSAFAALYQIRSQAVVSRNQAASSALLTFYEKYVEVRKYRIDIISRFERNDLNLGRAEALHYFNMYWSFRELEWKYFERGMLGSDSLLEWAENALRHLDGKRNLKYFELGEVRELGSREVFETYVLDSVLKLSSARKFYISILKLAQTCELKGQALDSKEAIDELRKLVRSTSRRPKKSIV